MIVRSTSRTTFMAGLMAGLITLSACANDDGAGVRDLGGNASKSQAGGSGSAASGSTGSGLSANDVDGDTDNPLLISAVEKYDAYVHEQVNNLVKDTRTLTDAVRSGDLEAAKAAYAPSRVSWERIEPIAGLIEDVDVAVDARVDDFASENDPKWTGWHRIEYLLWEKRDVAAAKPFADRLDTDIEALAGGLAKVKITPLVLVQGSAELVEEVSEGKITGEEDRYSHTDLWDFQSNIEGARQASELVAPALQKADPELAERIESEFDAVQATLDPYRRGDGFASFTEVTEQDRARMKAALAGLSESLSTVAGTLNLK